MADYDLYAQAISSFNNTLANNANVIMASNTSKQDRQFSREMSDLAWQRNIEAWNMQNEYNLPANVYARQLAGLQANGLNPNLVYGNSSSVQGTAGGVSPYKFENYHSTAVPHYGQSSTYQDLLSTRLLQTQVAAQEAQNRLINARADNEQARTPGIVAKSDEAAYRWNFITRELTDDYEAAVRAEMATKYWTGQQTMYNADYARDRSKIEFYKAAMAEWLNTTNVPGTHYTYQQYMERYKAMLPAAEFKKLKYDVLDIASRIAYRKKQGEYLDLKMEYQRYVNEYAKTGRVLGNDWLNVLFSGLGALFGFDSPQETLENVFNPYELGKKFARKLGSWVHYQRTGEYKTYE